MIYAIIAIIILVVLYLLALNGRRGHRGLRKLRGWAYAHRGLHGAGVPENSMLAFRKALEGGYGIEFDVHLMKDGKLAVIHDTSLKRTAGVDVKITDLRAEDLADYRLEGTDEQIPLFCQVLELFSGKAPLIIELKSDNNAAELVAAAVKILETYEGPYCIESFDPRLLAEVGRTRPRFARGQLVGRSVKEKHTKSLFLNIFLVSLVSHTVSRPDFVACDINMKGNLSVYLCRKLFGVPVFGWTVRTDGQYNACRAKKMNTIFENIKP